MSPSKHNILCDGKSSGEIIDSHEDFSFRQARQFEGADNKKRTVQDYHAQLEPEITVVREVCSDP